MSSRVLVPTAAARDARTAAPLHLRHGLQGLVRQAARASHAAARLVFDLLRELGDERPYGRFLAATGQAHSAQAWRQFTDQRLQAKFKRPRCC